MSDGKYVYFDTKVRRHTTRERIDQAACKQNRRSHPSNFVASPMPHQSDLSPVSYKAWSVLEKNSTCRRATWAHYWIV